MLHGKKLHNMLHMPQLQRRVLHSLKNPARTEACVACLVVHDAPITEIRGLQSLAGERLPQLILEDYQQ